jgi:hypothetical protein
MDTPEQRAFRERVLKSHIARSTGRKGTPHPDLPAASLAPVPGTNIEMKTDAAIAAGNLLAGANRDLIAAKAAGDLDALRTIRITATSGYRSRGYQERLWRRYFGRYYNQTATQRAKLSGGPHGDEAVSYMVRYVSPKIGAPGFSNHQAGLAIDFWQERTKGNGIENSTKPAWVSAWQASWFFRWLNTNAARFGFYPYIVEPWHWEYRPAQSSVRPVAHSPAVSAQPASRSMFGTVFQQMQDAVRRGKVTLEMARALLQGIASGIRDVNELTNRVFFARHPERGEKRLQPSEPHYQQLVQGWLQIRDRVVQPALNMVASAGRAAVAPAAMTVTGDIPQGPFATLTIAPERFGLPERMRFQYPFTPEDVCWTARLIKGEAGGQDDLNNHAVIWAMFNRFMILTHHGSLWFPQGGHHKFHDLLRRYSTPLQPELKSAEAAKRAIGKGDFVPTGGLYPGTNIPRGQRRAYHKLQTMSWYELVKSGAGLVAERALKGEIPNPGIGNASEFASTHTILYYKLGKKRPSSEEWIAYTNRFKRDENFQWVGQKPPFHRLDQKKNAFFVRTLRIPGDPLKRRISDLPEGIVQIIVPR